MFGFCLFLGYEILLYIWMLIRKVKQKKLMIQERERREFQE